MTIYLSNRDGNGKTSEEGHYKFQTQVWSGNVLGSTALEVTQNSPANMSVVVSPGQYKIDMPNAYSYTGWSTANEVVPIGTADPANPRITSIVLYTDRNAPTSPTPPNNPGITKLMSVNGTPSAVPSAPVASTIQAAVGAGNPYIILANVRVNAAVTSVTNVNITDMRQQVTVGSSLISQDSLIDGAVSTSKLANLAVTDAKIASGAVTTTKLLDGAVTDAKWRNGVAFYAVRVAARTVTASTFTLLACDSVPYNYGGGYSNAGSIGRFTAPVSGIYAFNARVNFSAGGATTRAIIELRKNGSTSRSRSSDYQGPAGTVIRIAQASLMYQLNAGDYVEAYLWSSASVNIASDQPQAEMATDFGGYLVTRT